MAGGGAAASRHQRATGNKDSKQTNGWQKNGVRREEGMQGRLVQTGSCKAGSSVRTNKPGSNASLGAASAAMQANSAMRASVRAKCVQAFGLPGTGT
jgi:hypothetical protein